MFTPQTAESARETILARGGGSIPNCDLVGRDLREADLTGLRMACGSLRGVDLRGADLSGACLSFVDFSGARLDGAKMTDASFYFADFRGTSLKEVSASGVYWENTSLAGADFAGSDLADVKFRTCSLERANFDGARMSSARLVACLCDDTSFRNVDFSRVFSSGSTYRGAEFAGARRFYNCRDMLAELLSREIGQDFEFARSVGAIGTGRGWCWDSWASFLTQHPSQFDRALVVFSKYPRSGASQALMLAVRRLARKSPQSS